MAPEPAPALPPGPRPGPEDAGQAGAGPGGAGQAGAGKGGAGHGAGAPASSLKGALAMVLSMALFVTNDTLVKLALRDVPLGEIMSLRSVMAGAILLVVLARSGAFGLLPYAFKRRVLGRSVLDMVANFVYLGSLAVMPIASTTTIYLAAPLITIALAVPFLKEKVSPFQWTVILIGFAGAVIVMRPDPATFHWVAILPFISAFCASVRDIYTRGIGREIPGAVVSFSATVVLGLGGVGLGLFEPWRPIPLWTLAYIVAAGAAFSGATLTLVFAFRNAPVSTVSPLRYLLVVGAIISGIVVFGDVPDAWSWVGIALVVGAGLYSISLEHRRALQARRAARAGGRVQPDGAVAAPSE